MQQQIRRFAILDLYIGRLAVVLLTSFPIALLTSLVFDLTPGADFWPMLIALMSFYVLFMIPSVLLVVAARKMRRLESYAWAVTASLLVMLSVIGLPIGLWSLAVLTGRGVRSMFGNQETSQREPGR